MALFRTINKTEPLHSSFAHCLALKAATCLILPIWIKPTHFIFEFINQEHLSALIRASKDFLPILDTNDGAWFAFSTRMAGCTGATVSRPAAARVCTTHTGAPAAYRASTTVPTSGAWARVTRSTRRPRHSRPTCSRPRRLRPTCPRPTSNATKTPFTSKFCLFFFFAWFSRFNAASFDAQISWGLGGGKLWMCIKWSWTELPWK